MSAPTFDLTSCDREPIHIPGAIQPHGILLVLDAATGRLAHGAGDVAGALGRMDWLGAEGAEILGLDPRRQVAKGPKSRLRGHRPPDAPHGFDICFHPAGAWLLVELEATTNDVTGTDLLNDYEVAAGAFERAANLTQLCAIAAEEFRRLTRYDRVMVYRFLDDDAGVVVGEDLAPGQHSFLNHRFPASDIPKQARALYLRNLVRVIPDVHYVPAPLEPAWTHGKPLDMSDSELRSVSPIHLQYLKNMGVAASASISIVKDGKLWGLVACHNATPLTIDPDRRSACRALAAGLSRQIKAREETDAYRERVRLRTYEDSIVELLLRDGSLDEAISNHLVELMDMLDGDGVAVLRGRELVVGGNTPPMGEVRKLAQWIAGQSLNPILSTATLGAHYTIGTAHESLAGGILTMTMSASEPWLVIWFRAEEIEVVDWAGNPHKDVSVDPNGVLNPRSSFSSWTETVRGRCRAWSLDEVESARRLREAVLKVWQTRQILELNRQLLTTIEQKEVLLKQNEFLLGEINHRVQNSLQLVSSFLLLQSRESEDSTLRSSYEEARRRIAAVSLVHRRLYNSGHNETLDAARYVDELLDDLVSSMGDTWGRQLVRDLQPIVLPNDRAVSLGLVLTELIINANKYAYGGGAGPLRVTLAEDMARLRLIVEDSGTGRQTGRVGFGTRMLNALVDRLDGTIEYEDSHPGTRVTMVAPIKVA